MRPIPIYVNGVKHPSAKAAARWIVANELKLGNEKKVNTIAKELRRCFKGASWKMYGKYEVKA